VKDGGNMREEERTEGGFSAGERNE